MIQLGYTVAIRDFKYLGIVVKLDKGLIGVRFKHSPIIHWFSPEHVTVVAV